MANIRLDLDYPLEDGQSLTFKAPCDCTEVNGIIVYYPTITEGASVSTSKVLTFKDTHGNTLTGIGNLFSEGAYVKVVVDTANNFAYIQNADTNGYLENKIDGKADSSHEHSVSDITSGVLAPERGGLGHTGTVTNAGAYAILRKAGDGNYVWYTNTANGAFYATGANTLAKFGTLPVAQGGTGVTSLSALATAMGAAKIETGSYTGTNDSFTETNVTITFSNMPKFVIFYCDRQQVLNSYVHGYGFYLWGANYAYWSPDFNDLTYFGGNGDHKAVTLSGNTMTFKAHKSTGNASGAVYNYIAFI
mgnify:CR=1 FL=1